MAVRRYSHRASLSFDLRDFELYDAEILGALLEPHAAFCRAHGIPMDSQPCSPERRTAFAALHSNGRLVPLDLAVALRQASELGAAGAAQVRQRALSCLLLKGTRGFSPAAPRDEALRLVVHHPKLALSARAWLRADPVRVYRERAPTVMGPISRPLSEQAQSMLRERAADHFGARGMTRYCGVMATELDNELLVSLVHGVRPKATGAIETDDERRYLHYHPDKHDELRLDRRTGVLAISAGAEADRALYARWIGEVLCDDADFFRAPLEFDLDAVGEDISSLQRTDDLPGVGRLELVELALRPAGRSGQSLVLRANDGIDFEDTMLRWVIRDGTIYHLKLRILFSGDPRRYAVSLATQGRASHARGEMSDKIRAVLARRGLFAASYAREISCVG